MKLSLKQHGIHKDHAFSTSHLSDSLGFKNYLYLLPGNLAILNSKINVVISPSHFQGHVSPIDAESYRCANLQLKSSDMPQT